VLLGLDVGTSSIKALLVAADGRELSAAAGATPFRGGEMTADDLDSALGGVIGQLGDARGGVAAVGIAGMAESGVALDRAGHRLSPIIAWHDPRGSEVVERLLLLFGPDLERGIGQRLRTVSSVAKLGWLIDHGVDPNCTWLGVPELVLHSLTGCQATEFSLAARTGGYHVGERRYLPEVISALGARSDAFAEVLPAGMAMGPISAEGAAWSGLPAGIPVTLAGHDHQAGLVGSGAGEGYLGNSVGTAEIVVLPDRPPPDPALVDRALAARVAVTIMPGGQRWALHASAARSGKVLATIAAAMHSSPRDLDHRAEGRAAASDVDGLIDAALRGDSLVVPAELAAAVWNGALQGLAARMWEAVDRLAEVVESPDPAWDGTGGAPSRPAASPGQAEAEVPGRPTGLVVFGGGSRSRPWLEAKASARPDVAVWRSPATEAVARGAALFAGVAAGWWPTPGDGPTLRLERITAPPLPWPGGRS
jgi:xylulokinase